MPDNGVIAGKSGTSWGGTTTSLWAGWAGGEAGVVVASAIGSALGVR